ncbi:MAG TPA: cell division protein FtsZ, partial [Methylophaga sp.]|nr:cell division protein FtsZ [Methylophaga sp.]
VDIDYDEPTVLRNGRNNEHKQVANGDVNMDYLDIPAFLRRQAD